MNFKNDTSESYFLEMVKENGLQDQGKTMIFHPVNLEGI